MNEAERSVDESKRIAEALKVEELERQVVRLTAYCEQLAAQLKQTQREVERAQLTADEALDDAEEADSDSTTSAGDSGGGGFDELPTPADPPHAFQVTTTPEGDVYCLLPKGTNGTFFPGALGGKHLGNDAGETAEDNAGPYPAGGQGSGSDEPSEWAHYGWYKVGTMDTSSEEVNDKIVVATFTVPVDPPESQRGSGTSAAETKGPKLDNVSLEDADDWPDTCRASWKEYDDLASGSVTRKVPIAMVANGLVTQLTMVPFISLGGGGADDWHADSEKEIFLSIDPPNSGLQYETETVDKEVQEQIGVDENGAPVMRTVVKKVTQPKMDENDQPIVKKKKVHAVNPDGSEKKGADGKPIEVEVDDLAEETYHQVHNFESGNDGAEIEIGEDGYPKDLVATRVKKGAGYELMWRKLPKMPEPCHPAYSLSEDSSEPCGTKIVLAKTEYAKDAYGDCQAGTQTIVGSVTVPAAPIYALEVSGTCTKTVRLKKTNCGGSSSDAGDTFSFDIPPAVSVIPATPPADASSRVVAGTITTTPCTGNPTTITVYHGKNGEDGQDGKDGCGIGSITQYWMSSKESTPGSTSAWTPGSTYGPGGSRSVWSTTRPNTSTQYPYLWSFLRVSLDCPGVPDKWLGPYLVGTHVAPTDGCSPTVSPASGSSSAGEVAGTITDCDGNTITIRHGCSPTVMGTGSQEPGAIAATITDCSGTATHVYNGRNGTLNGDLWIVSDIYVDETSNPPKMMKTREHWRTDATGNMSLVESQHVELGIHFIGC